MAITFLTDEDGKKFVKSINGAEPDESGNVQIDVGEGSVKTVNGIEPDENGNVEVETSGDCVSPTVSIEAIPGGHRVIISDAEGTKSMDVMDGSKGDKGDKGDTGSQGAKGDQGETGPQGEQGFSVYYSSRAYKNPDLAVGDGYMIGLAEINLSDRALTGGDLVITADGHLWEVDYINGDQASIHCIGNLKGGKGDKGDQGDDGRTPVKGEDYFTDSDVQNIVNRVTAGLGGDGRLGIGENVAGKVFNVNGESVTAQYGAERFNDYYNNIATGAYSHAEGMGATASGGISHAEGDGTTASGGSAHAEGQETTASGSSSHAEGINTTASKDGSHAEGRETTASGEGSHAEGYTTTAKGYASHAEGWGTKATQTASHAEGRDTVASNVYAHAEGEGTIANVHASHVQGKYNVEDIDYKYAHILGNGASDSERSNAHTVDWAGNAWFAGDIYIGGTSQDDPAAQKLSAGGGSGGSVNDVVYVTLDKETKKASHTRAEIKSLAESGKVLYLIDELDLVHYLDDVNEGKFLHCHKSGRGLWFREFTIGDDGKYTSSWDNLDHNSVVRTTAQLYFTDSEKSQARENIGAIGSVNGIKATYGGNVDVVVDWNVKEGEAGHVLNRTHYTESGRVALLEETTVKFNGAGEANTEPFPITAGDTYIVNWNGVEYECIAQDVSAVAGREAYVLGNRKYLGMEDTGEPFIIASMPFDGIGTIGAFDGVTSATISIYHDSEVVHKLDHKYLPNGVPYAIQDVLLEETDAVKSTEPKYGEVWAIGAAPVLTIGETYTVIYNGVPYDCVAMDGSDFIEGSVLMGNPAAGGGADTGEPFAMVIAPVYQLIMNMDLSGATSVRIGIEKRAVHKLDPKCLPDGYPYSEKGMGYALPETDMEVTSGYITTPFSLTIGETYIVTIGGVEYTVTAEKAEDDGQTFVGLVTDEFTLINVPDGIDGLYGVFQPNVDMDNYILSIYGATEITHPIALKYLPESVPNVCTVMIDVSYRDMNADATATVDKTYHEISTKMQDPSVLVRGYVRVYYNDGSDSRLLDIMPNVIPTISFLLREVVFNADFYDGNNDQRFTVIMSSDGTITAKTKSNIH